MNHEIPVGEFLDPYEMAYDNNPGIELGSVPSPIIPHTIHVWYIYLHKWLTFMVN